MTDDDKTKGPGAGFFDPEEGARVLASKLSGEKTVEPEPKLELEEKTADLEPVAEEPVAKKSVSQKPVAPKQSVSPKVERNIDDGAEEKLKEYFWALRAKYENRGFFNDNFTTHDLSDVLDLLYKTLSAEDRQNFLEYLSEDMNRVKGKDKKNIFSPTRFLETHLYGYANFEKSLLENDLHLAGLAGEAKEQYEAELLALGKFLARQNEFIKATDIPSYKEPAHKKALKSLDYSWHSLYLNDEDRLLKAVPNQILRQFWFADNKGHVKAKSLTDGQKRELVHSLDILNGDWRRFAKFTVDWEIGEVQKLFDRVLTSNGYLKTQEKDLEMLKKFIPQILFDARFEAKRDLKTDKEMDLAEKCVQKWLAPNVGDKKKVGLLSKIYGDLLGFDKTSKQIQSELLFGKLKPEEIITKQKQLVAMKDRLLLSFVKMEADLLRESGAIEKPESKKAELRRPAKEKNPVVTKREEVKTKLEEVDTKREDLEPKEESKPETFRSSDEILEEAKLLFAEADDSEILASAEESVEKIEEPLEEKTEARQDYKINPKEYTFLHRILADENLREVIFKNLADDSLDLGKEIIKVSTNIDLPVLDKKVFDKLWEISIEVFHDSFNQLLMDFEKVNSDDMQTYLANLSVDLGVNITPGYDVILDQDELLKRLRTYSVLKNKMDMDQA